MGELLPGGRGRSLNSLILSRAFADGKRIFKIIILLSSSELIPFFFSGIFSES